jgi:type I restriction enzyme S subunit
MSLVPNSKWPAVALHRIAPRRQVIGRSDLPALSVFLDDGVVPRSLRTDNYNQLGDDLARYLVVEPGDLVFNKLRTWQGGLGVSRDVGIVSPAYYVCRPTPSVWPRFLHYLLRSAPYLAELTRISKWMPPSQFDISWDELRLLPIHLPPLDTQRAIADFLDAKTAELERIVTAKQRIIELLEMRWRSTAAHRLVALINLHGSIPLKRLTECLDSRRIPLSAEERTNRQGPYPYYGASAVVDHVDGYIFDEPLVLVGEDGAQLGDPAYPIAQRIEGKAWVNNHAHVLRPTGADPDLLVLHLNTFDRVPFMSGSTREKITQDDLGRIPCPNLPVEDQRREMVEIVAARDRCIGAVELLNRQIVLLAERRQALITAAVTGHVSVPEAA